MEPCAAVDRSILSNLLISTWLCFYPSRHLAVSWLERTFHWLMWLFIQASAISSVSGTWMKRLKESLNCLTVWMHGLPRSNICVCNLKFSPIFLHSIGYLKNITLNWQLTITVLRTDPASKPAGLLPGWRTHRDKTYWKTSEMLTHWNCSCCVLCNRSLHCTTLAGSIF